MSDKKVLQNQNDIQAAYYDSYDDYYASVAETVSSVNATKNKFAQLRNRNNVNVK